MLTDYWYRINPAQRRIALQRTPVPGVNSKREDYGLLRTAQKCTPLANSNGSSRKVSNHDDWAILHRISGTWYDKGWTRKEVAMEKLPVTMISVARRPLHQLLSNPTALKIISEYALVASLGLHLNRCCHEIDAHHGTLGNVRLGSKIQIGSGFKIAIDSLSDGTDMFAALERFE